jgi:hypothetical protein
MTYNQIKKKRNLAAKYLDIAIHNAKSGNSSQLEIIHFAAKALKHADNMLAKAKEIKRRTGIDPTTRIGARGHKK